MPLTNDMLRVRTSQLAENNARPARAVIRERSYSEETITPEISLTVSAVLAAFTILSEDLSSLPLILYERRGRNKFRAFDNMYYRLMHDEPNPEHTSMTFREFLMGHLLGWGNFFAQPIFDKQGDVVELWPLRPDRMTVKRFEGERVYIYQASDGKQKVFLAEEILHIPAFGFDGLIGYSRIALARNSIGFAISLDKYGSKFFANGAHIDVVYKHPGELSDLAYGHLKESLEERTGVENSHRPIILEENMSIEKLGLPNDDAQFLESRKFQVGEIARIFRVPPHMIGDVDKTTSWGSGIDSQEQGYVNHTLRPWARRTDEHLNLRLLPLRDRGTFFYEHLMDGLLIGDIQTRYEAYVKAVTNGWMTRNEVRVKENMNTRKGLDDLLVPANMIVVKDTSNGGNGENGNAANALEPIWRDAIARVLKRESNDVLGASKRYQVKGQQVEFNKWLDQFYTVDHPAFVRKQFQPIVDAASRLFGAADLVEMDDFIFNFLFQRCEWVKASSAEQIAAGMDAYMEDALQEIMKYMNASVALRAPEEDDDEE